LGAAALAVDANSAQHVSKKTRIRNDEKPLG
jgi:hypothetical protein